MTRQTLFKTRRHPKLKRLLEEAAKVKMTRQEIWDQRVSFAYGQLMDCAPKVTKDEVRALIVETYGPRPEK